MMIIGKFYYIVRAKGRLLGPIKHLLEIYPAAKDTPGLGGIFFDCSRHVETVVLMSSRNRRIEN